MTDRERIESALRESLPSWVERERMTRIIAALEPAIKRLLAEQEAASLEVDGRAVVLLDECEPYLKEGETPAECLDRNRKDIDALMTLLAREKKERLLTHQSGETCDHRLLREELDLANDEYRIVREERDRLRAVLEGYRSFLEVHGLEVALDPPAKETP